MRALAGLALVAAGVVLLTDRVGGSADAARLVARWWPAALIVLAVAHALTFVGPPLPRAAGRVMPLAALASVAVIAAGLLLLTTRTLPRNLSRLLLALALVAAGVLLATVHPALDRRYQNWVAVSAVMRRARLRSRGRDVQLVTVRAVLGQVAVDLTEATLPPRGAEIHATVVGGSIILRLPAGWQVKPRPVAEPTLELVVVPPDPALRVGPARPVPLSLTGAHGRLLVEWVDSPNRSAPATATAPPAADAADAHTPG
jgi:hypothetical protein